MPKLQGAQRKQAYFQTISTLFDEYKKVIIVQADNVGSRQMQQIRKALRGKGVVLMGKNTMVRKALRGILQKNPNLEPLMPRIYGNIGFVFSNGDLKEVKDVILANRVGAPARAGAIAPNPVVIPAGGTGLDPAQTNFFQALNIPTKISKGVIEIINDVPLINTGDKVTASQAALLAKLNIRPFTYGLRADVVYDDGQLYGPELLDITNADLSRMFGEAVDNVAALSLGLGLGNKASAPHLFISGVKNVCAAAIALDYEIKATEITRKMLANPGAFAAAPAAAAPAADSGKKEAKKEEKKEEEEDGDMGLGLFD